MLNLTQQKNKSQEFNVLEGEMEAYKEWGLIAGVKNNQSPINYENDKKEKILIGIKNSKKVT